MTGRGSYVWIGYLTHFNKGALRELRYRKYMVSIRTVLVASYCSDIIDRCGFNKQVPYVRSYSTIAEHLLTCHRRQFCPARIGKILLPNFKKVIKWCDITSTTGSYILCI